MWAARYWPKTYWARRYWPPVGTAPPPPVVVTTDGDGLPRKRHKLTAAEREAIAATERAWDEHQAKRQTEDRKRNRRTDAALNEIMDRHLGIVRRKEAPPPITAATVVAALPPEVARTLDLAGLESDLSEIRRLLADHRARIAGVERKLIELEEIEMLIAVSL